MVERDWKREYGNLPKIVRDHVYETAKTSCPSCGVAGIPASWAVATAETYEALLADIRATWQEMKKPVNPSSAVAYLHMDRLLTDG